MPCRPLVIAALGALLAACQTTRSPEETLPRISDLDLATRADLRQELVEVKSLLTAQLAARAEEPVSQRHLMALAAHIQGLEQGIEALRAAALGADMSSAREASFDAAAAVPAVDILAGALDVLERKRSVLCENIANVDVPGFRRRRLLVTNQVCDVTGMRVPCDMGEQIDQVQGVLALTGNQLDFAIEGAGFFEVQLPNGELRYTRCGTFRQDVNGRIVTAQGYRLTDPVTIPPVIQGVSVSNDGHFFAVGEQNSLMSIGTIRLHLFPNARALRATGGTFFVPTESSGQATDRQPGVHGAGALRQGYIERSNLTLSEELFELQRVEREAAAVRRALAGFGIDAR